MRHLLDELLPDDPGLECDQGQDLITYCWQYLTAGVSPETLQFARMYHEMLTLGIKLPELKLGQSQRAMLGSL